MNNRSEDMVHQVAGGRRGVDALREADQVDVVCLEVLDGFEQINEEAAEAVQAGNAGAVAGGGMVDQLRPPRALEPLDGNHVREDTDGAGLTQAVLLEGVNVLVRDRHAGIAEDASHAVRAGLWRALLNASGWPENRHATGTQACIPLDVPRRLFP